MTLGYGSGQGERGRRSMEADIETRSGRGEGSRPEQQRRLKVAYVMSRFPKLTETFVLYEMLAVEEQGVDVELYPLLREREPVVHHDAVAARASVPIFSRSSPAPILRSHLVFLRHRPRTYLATLWEVVRGTWGSPNFFAGALGIFPKVVHDARLMDADGRRPRPLPLRQPPGAGRLHRPPADRHPLQLHCARLGPPRRPAHALRRRSARRPSSCPSRSTTAS